MAGFIGFGMIPVIKDPKFSGCFGCCIPFHFQLVFLRTRRRDVSRSRPPEEVELQVAPSDHKEKVIH